GKKRLRQRAGLQSRKVRTVRMKICHGAVLVILEEIVSRRQRPKVRLGFLIKTNAYFAIAIIHCH
ncbi:MAG: hypothetical protein KDE50_33395, partial [Caldilineaceae bacterium]|nr:hypothetical protein [Caldilineaceae bacterium]